MHRPLAFALAGSLAFAPACLVQHRITVTGDALHRSMRERQSSGTSEVPGLDHGEGAPRATRVTIVRGSRLWIDGRPVDVDELERDCPDQPAPGPGGAPGRPPIDLPPPAAPSRCALERLASAEIQVRRFQGGELSHTGKLVGAGVLVVGAGAALCYGLCDEDSRVHDASRGVLSAAALVAVGYIAVWYLFLRGSGT
jgi:hypothetical protein